MAYFETGDLRLRYQTEGTDDTPWLILSNSLGTRLEMWEPQMTALRERFRVLRYDARGHGESSVPPGPYTVPELARDVIELMDHLGIERAHHCGLSMGGMIAMWLGSERPARISRLVLANTAARIGTAELWNARIDKVNREGMTPIAPAVIDRWFTPGFQERAPEKVNAVRQMLLDTPPAGYTASCAAVRDMDQRSRLATITAPTLVIAGTHDLSTPPQDSELVADRIAGARYVELDAAHLSNWEMPDLFTTHLVGFLTEGA
jgi:3-oxoadipate enol-lactonase